MTSNEETARGAAVRGVLTIEIRYRAAAPAGVPPQIARNPIPAIGQLLVGVSELERQMRHSVAEHPHLGEFSLTPTVLSAGEPEHPDEMPGEAAVVLAARTVPATPHAGLRQLISTLAQQIAGEAGVDCVVDVIADRPVGRLP